MMKKSSWIACSPYLSRALDQYQCLDESPLVVWRSRRGLGSRLEFEPEPGVAPSDTAGLASAITRLTSAIARLASSELPSTCR